MPARLAPLALFLPLLGSPVAAEDGQAGRLSLEELLQRWRGERDALLGELRDRVQRTLTDLDGALAAGRPEDVEAAFARLMKLGPASAPLLAPALDPGPSASAGQAGRARLVARALRELGAATLVDELLARLPEASPEGRRNLLRVLGASGASERVSAAVRALLATSKGEERQAPIAALAELGGPENERLLAEQLARDDRQLSSFVLRSLADGAVAGMAPAVLSFLRASSNAPALVPELLAFWRAAPQAVSGEVCAALVELAKSRRPSSQDTVRILEFLPEYAREWSSSVKRELRSLVDATDRDVAEAALVALARSGDRAARRDLLAPYDQRVADLRNGPGGHESRANVLYRIEDYKNALKDYQEALKLQREGAPRGVGEPLHVKIARCYARMGKHKDSFDWLERAPISMSERRALAADPAFADLVAHARYRSVFRL